MPELPEVETIKRGLNRLIVGYQVLDIKTDSPQQIKPSLNEVKRALLGNKIEKIERRGKLLQIFFSKGTVLGIHLKLTGRLLVRKKNDPHDKWQHITISLSGDKELRFADSRKFGWFKLFKDKKELEKVLSELGKEPLDDLKLKDFKEILSSSRRPVKVVLMDQAKIAGVGNIYANDALFLSGIDPRRAANKITDFEIKKLYEALEKVLRLGIKERGASDQYYLDASGRKGSYQKHFLVYGRAGEKCRKCQEKIKRINVGGRGTFYCPYCQKEKILE